MDKTPLPHEKTDCLSHELRRHEASKTLKEDKDLIKAIDDSLDKVNTEGLEELVSGNIKKEYLKYKEEKEKAKKMESGNITNRDLLSEQLKTRSAVIDLKDNISSKRVEIIDMFNEIKGLLSSIKKHINKWFIGILILTVFFGYSLGVITAVNKDVLWPWAQKVINLLDTGRKINNITN